MKNTIKPKCCSSRMFVANRASCLEALLIMAKKHPQAWAWEQLLTARLIRRLLRFIESLTSWQSWLAGNCIGAACSAVA